MLNDTTTIKNIILIELTSVRLDIRTTKERMDRMESEYGYDASLEGCCAFPRVIFAIFRQIPMLRKYRRLCDKLNALSARETELQNQFNSLNIPQPQTFRINQE